MASNPSASQTSDLYWSAASSLTKLVGTLSTTSTEPFPPATKEARILMLAHQASSSLAFVLSTARTDMSCPISLVRVASHSLPNFSPVVLVWSMPTHELAPTPRVYAPRIDRRNSAASRNTSCNEDADGVQIEVSNSRTAASPPRILDRATTCSARVSTRRERVSLSRFAQASSPATADKAFHHTLARDTYSRWCKACTSAALAATAVAMVLKPVWCFTAQLMTPENSLVGMNVFLTSVASKGYSAVVSTGMVWKVTGFMCANKPWLGHCPILLVAANTTPSGPDTTVGAEVDAVHLLLAAGWYVAAVHPGTLHGTCAMPWDCICCLAAGVSKSTQTTLQFRRRAFGSGLGGNWTPSPVIRQGAASGVALYNTWEELFVSWSSMATSTPSNIHVWHLSASFTLLGMCLYTGAAAACRSALASSFISAALASTSALMMASSAAPSVLGAAGRACAVLIALTKLSVACFALPDLALGRTRLAVLAAFASTCRRASSSDTAAWKLADIPMPLPTASSRASRNCETVGSWLLSIGQAGRSWGLWLLSPAVHLAQGTAPCVAGSCRCS